MCGSGMGCGGERGWGWGGWGVGGLRRRYNARKSPQNTETGMSMEQLLKESQPGQESVSVDSVCQDHPSLKRGRGKKGREGNRKEVNNWMGKELSLIHI